MPSTHRALHACALAFAAAAGMTHGFVLPTTGAGKAAANAAPATRLQASTLEPPATAPAGVGGEGIIRPAGSGRRCGSGGVIGFRICLACCCGLVGDGV